MTFWQPNWLLMVIHAELQRKLNSIHLIKKNKLETKVETYNPLLLTAEDKGR